MPKGQRFQTLVSHLSTPDVVRLFYRPISFIVLQICSPTCFVSELSNVGHTLLRFATVSYRRLPAGECSRECRPHAAADGLTVCMDKAVIHTEEAALRK